MKSEKATERKEREAQTVHGTIEYETVKCANCGNEVIEEEAVGIMIDPYERQCEGALICDAKHPKPSKSAAFCPFCAETVFDYTRGSFFSRNYLLRARTDAIAATVLAFTAIFCSLLLLWGLSIIF